MTGGLGRLAAFSAMLALLAGAATAAPLVVLSGPAAGSAALFGTEIRHGHDMALRDGSSATGQSAALSGSPSGTTHDWMLSYDGGIASLTFGGITRSLNLATGGTWSMVALVLRAADMQSHMQGDMQGIGPASIILTIDRINGEVNTGAAEFTAYLGEYNQVFLGLEDGGSFESLSGTLTFLFEVAGDGSDSPGTLLTFLTEAYDADYPLLTNSNVPSPGGLLLFGPLALAYGARRSRLIRGR